MKVTISFGTVLRSTIDSTAKRHYGTPASSRYARHLAKSLGLAWIITTLLLMRGISSSKACDHFEKSLELFQKRSTEAR